MDKEIKEMLNVIVGMVEEVGKKVDRLEGQMQEMKTEMQEMKTEMQEMKTEMQEMKTKQVNMNEKLDALSSMYGRHEVAIQVLEKKKII